MNDTPTRRSLDALAELYLTGPAPAGSVRAEAQPPDDPAGHPDAAQAPQVPERAPGRAESRPHLFLHDGPGAERPAPRLEAVVLGHLPGYASPWISQYADEAARRYGGAALLRVAERQVSLELFDADLAGGDQVDESPQAPAGGPEDLLETLEAVAGRIGVWLVVLDEPEGSVTRRRLADLDRWTILTGADDAAVVGAYRMIKSLAGEGGPGPPRDGVGLMFVGCGQSAAERAAERVRSAAAYVMRLPVELVGHRRRMDAVRRRPFGRFAFDRSDPWRMLNGFFGELLELGGEGRARPAPALVSDEEALSGPANGEASDRPSADQPKEPPAHAAAMPRRRRPPNGDTLEPQVVAAIDAVKPLPVDRELPAPKPRTAAPPDPPGVVVDRPSDPPGVDESGAYESDPEQLAAYVPGVEPLAGRCPRQPEVRIGIDAAGRFHVMRRAEAPSPVDAAVCELVEASAWVEEHRDLLELTRPGGPGYRRAEREPADPQPVLHLFTDNPKAALQLAYAGPAGCRPIRLHLLKRVRAGGGRSIPVHEELN